ncbi:MAG: protein phosphatase 2C domain-containing protein [bacterium]
MKAVCRQDIGRRRENNEDSILIDLENGIFLLADGMGGHQGGEIASAMAVSESYALLSAKPLLTTNNNEVTYLLVQALYRANEVIQAKAAEDQNLKGMGTTLIGVVVHDSKAYFCHIGDSRLYLRRQGLQQITKDQTLAQQWLDTKEIDHNLIPARLWHVLTQAVGTSERLEPQLGQIDLQSDDLLVLCSDGLTDMLNDDEITEILVNNSLNLDQTAQALIDAANDRGGRDNISIILIQT